MIINQPFKDTQEHFKKWWAVQDIGRPLVRIVGVDGQKKEFKKPKDYKTFHMNAQYKFDAFTYENTNKSYFGEAFPYIDLNMGPGSMAAYLGCEPVFDADTVWYKERAKESLEELKKLAFEPQNFWWKEHFQQVLKIASLVQETPVLATIPDILENIDILALLRKPQDLCYDLIDEPELVEKYITQLDDLYFEYYDRIYDAVKEKDGGCAYTAFSIWAPNSCAKIQCDFSALMSPTQYNEFILPSLLKQCNKIPFTMYHLDGPDAIRHLDSILSMENLNALQWTPGVTEVDGGDEKWFPLYDKVIKAGKSLWILMDQGDVMELIEKSRKITERYGSKGIYFVYRELPIHDAQMLYSSAENNFR